MGWYKVGTVSVTNGSATVTGSGTAWIANVKAGEAFRGPDRDVYEIASVNSDTSITLASNYAGSTASGQSYGILPTQDFNRSLASEAATLVSSYSTIATNAGAGKFGNGTAGAPSITFGSDTITGIYRPSANVLAVSTNGTEKLRVSSGGYVGIGTNNPLRPLHIASTEPAIVLDETDSTTDKKLWRFYPSAGNLVFSTVNDAFNASEAAYIIGRGAATAVAYHAFSTANVERLRIDDNGYVGIGTTTGVTGAGSSRLMLSGTNYATASTQLNRFSNDTDGAYSVFTKSRGTSNNTYTTVVSGDTLGRMQFRGADGTGTASAAEITAAADGAISTGVVPGRIQFWTSSSGGTSTERMRIDSAGNVGVGTAGVSTCKVVIGGALTGAASYSAYGAGGTIQSDMTTAFSAFATFPATQAASFTLPALAHFNATQGTFGAGSTVTFQYGFRANASLVGATNNYGFVGEIPSGSNRWNLFMGGTAANYLAGDLLVGSTGSYNVSGFTANNVQSTSTSGSSGFSSSMWNASASGTDIQLMKSRGATVGTRGVVQVSDSLGQVVFAGDDGTNFIPAASIGAICSGTPGTNDMPGSLVFSTTADGASSLSERMRIDQAGNVGIGATPIDKLNVSDGTVNMQAKPIGGSSIGYLGVRSNHHLGLTTNDTEHVRITNTGFVGIGTTSPGVRLEVVGPQVNYRAFSSDGAPIYHVSLKARGAAGAPATVQNGDGLGSYQFYGHDGTSDRAAASIYAAAAANPASSTVPGVLVFSTTPAGTSQNPIERLRITSTGDVLITYGGGLGYGIGSGGTVTQGTSRTTGVTLNKTNGAITLFTAAGSASWTTFTVTNSTVAATDTVNVSVKSGTNVYMAFVSAVAAGSFNVTFATTGGTASDAPVLNFAVLKAVTA